MSLIKRSMPTVIIGGDELDGLLNIMDRRISEMLDAHEIGAEYMRGAYGALSILSRYNYIDYPQEFMTIFENIINGN